MVLFGKKKSIRMRCCLIVVVPLTLPIQTDWLYAERHCMPLEATVESMRKVVFGSRASLHIILFRVGSDAWTPLQWFVRNTRAPIQSPPMATHLGPCSVGCERFGLRHEPYLFSIFSVSFSHHNKCVEEHSTHGIERDHIRKWTPLLITWRKFVSVTFFRFKVP